MELKSLIENDSGVENAVYGILMIAIVVMVALLIASLVLSQGGEGKHDRRADGRRLRRAADKP